MVNNQDEVTQDQQSLDAEQGENAATPQYVTAEQLAAMKQEVQQLRSENRGLQGQNDKGLNAIRRDMEKNVQTLAQQQFESYRNEMDKKTYLDGLDEEQREIVSPLYDKINQLEQQQVQQTQPQVNGQQEQGQSNQAQQQWEQVYQVVESMGVNRNDPNLRYSALDQTNNLTPEERSQQFFQSIGTAIRAKGGTPPAQPSPQQPQTQKPSTVSPPVEQPSGKAAPTYKNPDDVRSAYIEGKIEKAEYQQMLQKLQ